MFIRNLRQITSYVTRNRFNMLYASTALAIDLTSCAFSVLGPYLVLNNIQHNMDNDEIASDTEQTIRYVTGGIMIIASQTLPRLRNIIIDALKVNVQNEITRDLVIKTFNSELEAQVTSQTGEFTQALNVNYSTLENAIPSLFGQIIPLFLQSGSISTFLIYKYGLPGIIPISLSSIYLSAGLILEWHMKDKRVERSEIAQKGYEAVIAAVQNYKLAHEFVNVSYEMQKLDATLVVAKRKFRTIQQRDDANDLLLNFMSIIVFLGAVYLFIQSSPKKDLLLALSTYLMLSLVFRLDSFIQHITAFNSAIIDSNTVFSRLNRVPGISQSEKANVLDSRHPLSIEIKNLRFTYPNGKTVLNDISFSANPGECIAIVGPSGSGKSTLLKLLMRFYEFNSGQILINDSSIQDFTLESLRDHITIVSQEAQLFKATIFENILYGDREASSADVIRCAIASGLIQSSDEADFLQRDCGQSGSALSGGERQRVAIARALLKGGRLLLLDEATASLDPKTENAIQATLNQLIAFNPITTIIITHRLHTTASASRIYYVDGGKIKETGNFDALIRMNGDFARQLQHECQELGIEVSDLQALNHKKDKAEEESQANEPRSANPNNFWARKLSRSIPIPQRASQQPNLISDNQQSIQSYEKMPLLSKRQ